MKLVIVLSHLMDRDGKLNDESKGRADIAFNLFFQKKLDLVLTIGWSYRKDSEIPIALAYKDYLISKGIKKQCIRSDINSRDTVGDAIFSKVNLIDKINFSQVYIVTSDYHVERTKAIFEAVLPLKIKILGCKTNISDEIIQREKDSLKEFYDTFANTDFQSNDSLLDTLKNKHPFYNGKIYKKLESQLQTLV